MLLWSKEYVVLISIVQIVGNQSAVKSQGPGPRVSVQFSELTAETGMAIALTDSVARAIKLEGICRASDRVLC